MARHARIEEASDRVTPLRLVDPDPGAGLAPEVRAVLDAVAALHTAILGWATASAEVDGRAAAPTSGRHRRSPRVALDADISGGDP